MKYNKQEKMDYIRANYPQKNVTELAQDLDCHKTTVQRIMHDLQLYEKPRIRDKEGKIKFIKEHYKDMSFADMARILNCNNGSITRIVNELNLNSNDEIIKASGIKSKIIINKKAIDKQAKIDYIREHNYQSYDELSKALNCCYDNIRLLAKEAGIKITAEKTSARNKKLEFIKENFNTMTNEEMAKALNISVHTVKKISWDNDLLRFEQESCNPYKDEIFKNLKDFNCSNYYISNYGRIKNKNDKLMKQRMLRNGYMQIRMFKDDDTYKQFMTHRLVAIMFIPNPDNKPEVNHKDANKLNNHVDNLEWVTPKENMKHAVKNNLLCNASKGEKHPYAKYTEEDVRNVCIMLEEGNTYKEIMNKYPNYTRSWIQSIKCRTNWKHISFDYNF